MRRTLLDAAGAILVAEGPAALTMRRLAAAAGCSTTVLYTLFGGKDGLADALYREGFERFRRALADAAAAAGDDPIGQQVALGRAYRAYALAEPNLYRVMFMDAIPGFAPSAASLAVANDSLGVLADAVRDGMAAGALRSGDAGAAAEVLWAAAHGVVSLELAGHFPDPAVAADRFRTLCWAALTPLLTDPTTVAAPTVAGAMEGRTTPPPLA
jgi:AcrR family transcriptional regulator